MKLSFDKTATRDIELLARLEGRNLDDYESLSTMLARLVVDKLDEARQPQEKDGGK